MNETLDITYCSTFPDRHRIESPLILERKTLTLLHVLGQLIRSDRSLPRAVPIRGAGRKRAAGGHDQ